MIDQMSFISPNELAKYGIPCKRSDPHPLTRNFSTTKTDPDLEGFEKGVQTNTGAMCENWYLYRPFAKDKYFVKDAVSEHHMVGWGN